MFLHEVGPRDGLQGYSPIPLPRKLRYISLLKESGLSRIEVGSFADPLIIPQSADTGELLAQLPCKELYSVLVPNLRGYEQARSLGVRSVAVTLSANDDHNRRNLGRPVRETQERLDPLIRKARADGIWVRGYISTFFGYHDPADTPLQDAIGLLEWYAGLGVGEVSLADTQGVATPRILQERLRAAADTFDGRGLYLHLHTLPDQLARKVDIGLQTVIAGFDGSAGGIGGCHTDPLLGNADTLELASLLEARSLPTGADLDALARAAEYGRLLVGEAPASHPPVGSHPDAGALARQ